MSAVIFKSTLYYCYSDLDSLMSYVSFKMGTPIALRCDQCRAYGGGSGGYRIIGNKAIENNLTLIKSLLPNPDLPVKFIRGTNTARNAVVREVVYVPISSAAYDFDTIESVSLEK